MYLVLNKRQVVVLDEILKHMLLILVEAQWNCLDKIRT